MSGIRGRLEVNITVRASANEISSWRGGVLQVRVCAPPLQGRANAALEKLLAGALRVAPSRVCVVVGATSRSKVIQVDGLSTVDVKRLLGGG